MIVEAHSSFLGVPKDLAYILRMIIKNPNIARLVYHNTRDCLTNPECAVTQQQMEEMLNADQFSIIPRIYIDGIKRTKIIIGFNNYTPNSGNSFYRDHSIEIRIITHFDLWKLTDNDLRVYRIAGEIDSMLNGAKLSGIGVTNFVSATQDVYDENFGGLTLNYYVVRGTEDKQADIRPII